MGTLLHEALHTGFHPETVERAGTAGAMPEPGDLILIRTPGRVYNFGRRVARNEFGHVAVVVSGGMTMNIVLP